MAVTAHCVLEDPDGKELQGSAHLLAFREIEGSHSGENIAKAFYKILDEAGLKHKVLLGV